MLARLIDDQPSTPGVTGPTAAVDLYGALPFQVTGQQVSRCSDPPDSCPHPGPVRRPSPLPTELLGVDPAELRTAGLSGRKINTLRDLAGRMSDGQLDPGVLSGLSDDELMAELTAIPGIGPWTVQGVLLIALRRADVVLPGDLALRKAVQTAYQLDHLPTAGGAQHR